MGKTSCGIWPGMKGVLVTAPVQFEQRSKEELLDIFRKQVAEAYPQLGEAESEGGNDGDDDGSDDNSVALPGPIDVRKMLAMEKRELAAKSKNESKKVMRVVSSGCKGVIFLHFIHEQIDPDLVVGRYLTEVKRTGQTMTRHCIRMLPIHAVCQADPPQLSKIAAPLITNYFSNRGPTKFGVAYKSRNNQEVDRMTLITAVADCVPQPPHKVNLGHMDVSLQVQVIKGLCFFGIATNYHELAAFNVQALVAERSAESMPDAGKEKAAENSVDAGKDKGRLVVGGEKKAKAGVNGGSKKPEGPAKKKRKK